MSLNKRKFFPSDFGTSEFSNWWNGIWGFSWFKANEIAASGGPKDTRKLYWLKDQGIKHILCLDQSEMSVYNKYSMQVETLEFDVKLIKMEEFKAPDSETIDQLLQFLTSVYQKKKPLLVNCPDGRSGVVIALYFMEFYKFSSSEAIEKVQEKGGSIETRRQEDFLHRFYAMKRKTGVVKKSESVLPKRPQDFENSVKFDENANQWQIGEDSVFERQNQGLENSVKVDENGNVFLE